MSSSSDSDPSKGSRRPAGWARNSWAAAGWVRVRPMSHYSHHLVRVCAAAVGVGAAVASMQGVALADTTGPGAESGPSSVTGPSAASGSADGVRPGTRSPRSGMPRSAGAALSAPAAANSGAGSVRRVADAVVSGSHRGGSGGAVGVAERVSGMVPTSGAVPVRASAPVRAEAGGASGLGTQLSSWLSSADHAVGGGPGAPAATPLMWTELAFVRREAGASKSTAAASASAVGDVWLFGDGTADHHQRITPPDKSKDKDGYRRRGHEVGSRRMELHQEHRLKGE